MNLKRNDECKIRIPVAIALICSMLFVSAISYATTKNAICVASAGNNSSMAVMYPSGLPNVIDVASTSNANTPSALKLWDSASLDF